MVTDDDGRAERLSERAQSLWAKTPNRHFDAQSPEGSWLPLTVHMSDAAGIAAWLWDEWVPPSVKEIIARGSLPDGDVTSDTAERHKKARQIFIFLAAAHDLGKAIPAFQKAGQHVDAELLRRVEDSGLSILRNMQDPDYRPHPLASQFILERNGLDRSYAVVLGGHHGRPPTTGAIKKIKNLNYRKNTGFNDAEWAGVQDELFRYALSLAGMDAAPQGHLDMQAQVALSGLVIMADWLASDSAKFTLLAENERPRPSSARAEDAWKAFGLPPHWEARRYTDATNLFRERFGDFSSLRPVQERATEIVGSADAPGIVVIEAPMGEGKTEAALAAAEILAEKTGCGGMFFALPTMATSDGMFGRVKRWADRAAETGGRLQSIYLAHGKAHLNEEFEGIGVSNENVGDEGADNVTVNDWTRGRKKGMLANFVVGTIDQLLFMALMMKHLALRHLALAGKVIVVDECHAFDAYMNGYLTQALKWLGKYRTPVVILSATLPGRTRRCLIEAYLDIGSGAAREKDEPAWVTNRAYPVITYTDGAEVKQETVLARSEGVAVRIEYLKDERIAEKLDELLQDGGCAGVICDTVGRAQAMFESLGKHFNDGDVKLVHSRFLSIDRAAKESELRRLLGPDATLENGGRPRKLIVVGTQVLEQSLDIDFDVLISDIAPMDLLIQRIGRLHRHRRESRPQKLQAASCFITGIASRDDMLFEEVIENIYPRYLLMNTVLLLPDSIALPADISPLVQSAYDDRSADADERLAERYAAAKGTYDFTVGDKEARAGAFQIGGPGGGVHRNMVGWIDVERDDTNDKKAEASVRDTEDTLEVIVLWRDGTDRLRLFPWIEEREDLGDYELHPGYAPEESVARVLAACTVSLPLRKDWQIDGAIREFESSGPPAWQESHWLAGELFLILDEEFRCELIGFGIIYGWETGLQFHYKKKEGEQ